MTGHYTEAGRCAPHTGWAGAALRGDRFVATPEAGPGLSGGHRHDSGGWRSAPVRSGPVSIQLRLEGTRREASGSEPVHAVTLHGAFRW